MKKLLGVLSVIITLGLTHTAYAQGPLTAAGNLQVNSDANGNLMTAFGVASGTAGPLTAFPNLRLRTDANGNLLIAMNGGTATPNILCLDATNVDVCLQRAAAGVLNLTTLAAGTTFNRINFGTALSTNPAFKRNSNTQISVRLADDSADANLAAGSYNASASYTISGNIGVSATPPTVTSAGVGPSVTGSNGTLAFRVNVGTGGTATTVVMAMPTATTGWNCAVYNLTATAANRAAGEMVQQSSTASSVTVQYQTVATGSALAMTSGDIISFLCGAF